ncbi:UDP-glucose dehydrogenase family protein [Alicyclobacillus shizuokensis]|uniref:UDP-glucose dehydrogenase family protein n=1 Tax=Alicyclobacillus shizuokensis TaxID=392014 RepID=UPI000B1972EE|nr:UDP-glucose/GDP-mannose dehydrogenase family protein [Alicyclobacillus shizuokensis]
MNIAIVGMGYVGVCTAVALAAHGHQVVGVDIDVEKIRQLQASLPPIYEQGVAARLQKYRQTGHLRFTTTLADALADCPVVFVTVGTPAAADGSCDLSFVFSVAETIGRHMHRYTIVVIKSTVPVGTCEQVREKIAGELGRRRLQIPFDVVSNPEFLREGQAVTDALAPERIVLGIDSQRVLAVLRMVYRGFASQWVVTTPRNAEMIKYASNAFLASKVSFINQLARVCDQMRVDVVTVAHGMGLDPRIGGDFLRAGIGYGGSCFPKDVRALLHQAHRCGVPLSIVAEAAAVNETQVSWFLDVMRRYLGDLQNLRVALLGVTFKPHTDDLREAPALRLAAALTAEGAEVSAYDPTGAARAVSVCPELIPAATVAAAVKDADALVLVTEWPQLIDTDWPELRPLMRGDWLFDARNALDPARVVQAGFRYVGVGRGG